MENHLSARKSDHIKISLTEDVRSSMTSGLEAYAFVHQALPEIDLADILLEQTIFGKKVSAPILISSMTGGTPEAREINLRLAEAAQAMGVAMGLGSQRAALENPVLEATFQVRSVAPEILLMANLGAVQLNYAYGIDQCRRAVEMVEADALYLHLNPLQEALQPEGDTNFSGLVKKIEIICRELSVPVIAKEVGWGISEKAARMLVNAGVAAIDVAGAGGTSWSQVEMYRIQDPIRARVAGSFRDWGISTADSILAVKKTAPQLPVFASGGLRDGIDIAKCIALGAILGGMAGVFLKPATKSSQAVMDELEVIRQQIQVTMFAAGVKDIDGLRNAPLVRRMGDAS